MPPDVVPVVGHRADSVRAVVVARLSEQKGHRVLIEALKRLEETVRSRLEVVLVGDGPERGALERAAREGGVQASLVFAGHQDDVYPWLVGSDVALLPSLWEGFPLVILEAFECARPVIATRVAGVPEIVDESVGLLVEPGDAEGLAAALAATVERRDRLPELGATAYRRVRERFSLERMLAGYAGAFQRLLAGS
jgi:glycosyltransferase involved in cell wall biosynthesis